MDNAQKSAKKVWRERRQKHRKTYEQIQNKIEEILKNNHWTMKQLNDELLIHGINVSRVTLWAWRRQDRFPRRPILVLQALEEILQKPKSEWKTISFRMYQNQGSAKYLRSKFESHTTVREIMTAGLWDSKNRKSVASEYQISIFSKRGTQCGKARNIDQSYLIVKTNATSVHRKHQSKESLKLFDKLYSLLSILPDKDISLNVKITPKYSPATK